MPEFQPFLMERMMSRFEQEVEFNLSESGVHPLSLGELLVDDPGQVEDLLSCRLGYPHVNGLPELRESIASLYDGASAANVLVTVGAAEANYITIRTLLAAGDAIAIMIPNYMQIWGIARNHGLGISEFHLREEAGWSLDLNELDEAVSARTRLIAVCNPNNPTGYILAKEEMDRIVAVAEQAGAWILADEVYSGAERVVERQSPSFFGCYDRVIAIGSLSKAYGLPGLRIGWVVGPVRAIDSIWARHEYTTISTTMLSNRLAAIALSPNVRRRIIQRTRGFIRKGYPVLQGWMAEHGEAFSLVDPQAAAVAFVRYHFAVNSTLLAQRLRQEKGVLVVPGDHFGMDHFLRVSFGLPQHYLVAALDRIHEFVMDLPS